MKVFGTVCRRLLVALAASLLLCGLAQATVIFSGSLSVSAGDPTQLGRLSRNGVPQDWSGGEPFPGVINPATSYHYVTLDLDLGALEAGHVFGGFIQIIFDSVFTTTFLSAYLNTLQPGGPFRATGWATRGRAATTSASIRCSSRWSQAAPIT